MIAPTHASASRRSDASVSRPTLRRRTMCQFIALALFGGVAHAGTPPTFSQAWIAGKQVGAAQTPPAPGAGQGGNGGNVFTPANVLMQQRVQQSIANLNAAAQAVAAQMSAQKAAQASAQPLSSNIPDGLGDGGLKVAGGVGTDPSLWQNANAPTQSVAGGRTDVEIKQTASKAIMTWESFNVGRHTTVHFDQTGGTQGDGGNQWVALNRINDPSGDPSRILGQIKAEGTVYLLNRNGMVFGGGAQVNTHSLIASSLDLFTRDVSKSNAFFLKYGIGSTTDPEQILGNGGTVTGFLTDNGDSRDASTARGAVTVGRGASITTSKDGFVLIAAPSITQAGQIVADDGQAIMAAARIVAMAPTSNGSQLNVQAVRGAATTDGVIENTGLVQARRGRIQWLGEEMHQDGVLVSSTSLSHPGSIEMDEGSSGSLKPSVAFGGGSVTTILPEKDGETTTSTPEADAAFVTSRVDVNVYARLSPGSLMEVPAGNVTFARDTYVDGGATIDVSGLANVTLPMSALLVTIPRIGLNELANSPLLRDSFLFSAKDVTIDSTASGTRADGLDWVGSPILNVAGYVNNVPRTVDELMIRSGNIAFRNSAIIRTGAQLRLEGGFLHYLPGYISTPRLQAANGLVYDIASADPDVPYAGFAGVYTQDHARWGVTETYASPLLANMKRWDPGFIRGGDAGTLSFGQEGNVDRTFDLILDGDVSAHAYAGREQVRGGNEPLAGSLDIDVVDIASFNTFQGVSRANSVNVVIQSEKVPLESYKPDFGADDPLPERGGDPSDPGNPLWWHSLSTAMIDNAGFRKVRVSTAGTVLVKDGADLHVADGGEVDITATSVEVDGTVTSHGGAIHLSARASNANQQESVPSFLSVGEHGRLDASGLWVNDAGRAADSLQGDHWIDGGSVSLTGLTSRGSESVDITPDITLAPGSIIDVSGGGYAGADGSLSMDGNLPRGRGGDVAIQTHVDGPILSYRSAGMPDDLLGGRIDLGGTLIAEGFDGGGTLTLHAPRIQIGGAAEATPDVALLYLDPSMFSSLGFARYSLIADTDATVAPGAQVVVKPRAMVADLSALRGVGSREHLLGAEGTGDVATTGYVDAYFRYLHRGADDGLSLQAGTYLDWIGQGLKGVTGSVTVGEGARIGVDAGGTIALTGSGNVVVDGVLVAPGGKIALHNLDALARFNLPVNSSVWLGAHSELDAGGISLRDPAAGAIPRSGTADVPARNGTVLDGGTVELYSRQDVVAERGARVALSGASDTYDLPADADGHAVADTSLVATPVWSDAGSLDIQSGTGLYFDGSIDAHGGAAQARGGSLAISSQVDTLRPVRDGELILVQSGWRLPRDSDPFAVDSLDERDGGDLRFAVDRLAGSGIDDLYLGQALPGSDTPEAGYRNLLVTFAGDVSIDTARSIQLRTTGLASIDAGSRTASADGAASQGSAVSLKASYVALLGAPADTRPGATAGQATLDVDADVIDIGGRLNLLGFEHASFDSRGDVRFTLPTDDPGVNQTGWLNGAGDLEFTASRLYPMTHYAFLINAARPSSDTTVTFHQADRHDASTPLSAGGTLAVVADRIDQEGTLWVPSGSIVLGTDDPEATRTALGLDASMPLASTKDVHLAPGSLTSVSLAGAVLPYGTTQDGKDWHYENQDGQQQPLVDRPPEKSVSIVGDAVAVDAGATVDLSGGGDLQAVEWIPGTGGTRDVLAQTYTDYSTSQQGEPKSLYADGRPVYAILPGYDAPVSAHDVALELGAGAGPQIGQAVYLAGMPGLPDGVYTLLPARYATLPGAYRVVQDTAVTDAVMGASVTAPDGSHIVSGYFTDTLTGSREARNRSFIVQSAPTWNQYSEYSLTSAAAFFTSKAAKDGGTTPRLGADAGRLTIAATAALSLGATLDATPAKGGRASQVDISGDAIQVTGGDAPGLDGYLHVSADELSSLGAGSLLIGGKRESTGEGDRIDVLAIDVVLSNDASHPLQGSEIVLVANGDGGVTLGDGSVVKATVADDAPSTPLLIGRMPGDASAGVSGDGALLRVSGQATTPIVRADVTGLDGPAGTPGGHLSIGSGARIESSGGITLDATGTTSLSADAVLDAPAIDVTAGRIGLTATNPSPQDQAGSLLIGPRILAQLSHGDETILRGRQAIDFIGDVALSASNAITLSAPTIGSEGGHATLSADSLTISNDTGASRATAHSGDGVLQIDARQVHLGSGDSTLSGFSGFSAHASDGVYASGVGSIDLGTASVDVVTPRIVAESGSDNVLDTSGAMHLLTDGGAAAPSADVAGKIALQGGSIDVSTALMAPGGRIALHATQGDVRLDRGANVDVGGASLPFHDVNVSVPGGTIVLEADAGSVTASAGSLLDVSGSTGGGRAGTLDVIAQRGNVTLGGTLVGRAAEGYLGGVLSVDAMGAIDLGSVAALAGDGGLNGSVSIHTREGDLTLAKGQTLRSHLVRLTADGGDVDIAGDIDASGTFGGKITLFGATGVDIDGGLNTSASDPNHDGGDIAIGTSGIGDGHVVASYGYQEVQRADAGHIRIGSGARIRQDGTAADGKLYLRAPLLVDGDVPVDIAAGTDLSHSREPSLEAYAVWDTRDASSDPAKHFDGLVDAAGWFTSDPVTGRPVLVAGTFKDDAGNAVAGPDPADPAQVADYLARYRFTPDNLDRAHASFYGYADGDAGNGPGTLMGYIEHPGFAFESRLHGVAPALDVQPGIELRNGDAGTNGGDITVLTPWNLGAGTRDAEGALHLAYRYGDQAPIVSLRAEGNLDIRASITDGFYQDASAGGVGGLPPLASLIEAQASFQAAMDAGGLNAPQLFSEPGVFTSGDPLAIAEYYGQYVAYGDYLAKVIPELSNDFNPVTPAAVIGVGLGFSLVEHVDGAPLPLTKPTTLAEYPAYLAAYKPYLIESATLTDFADTAFVPDVFEALAAPPTTLDLIPATPAPVDNSPSPRAVTNNPLPILSANVSGGRSTSYRLVAGADVTSSDPTATVNGAAGSVLLGGHTDYADPDTRRVLAAPTVIRTGTGDIDIVAAADVRWSDGRAPAAVYTAGAPAAGTTADGTASILKPSEVDGLSTSAATELVVTGAVNPEGAGHLDVSAGRDIVGRQDMLDTTGDLTGTPGTPTAQYWWQWMQTNNSETRSSINFGAFDQGLMSAGGDVSVQAGGDIRQLSVSLPTTWAISTDASGAPHLQTYGGGDLDVTAGGDILSGSYFVARGQGNVQAGGRIGSDFSVSYATPSGQPATMPVSTLIAMQDSQFSIEAGESVSLGGIFDPSWLDSRGVSELLPAHHADGQGYSADSRIDVSALSGDLTYGDLTAPIALFAPGLVPSSGNAATDTAGDILPATVNFAAAQGDLSLLTSGELFPSDHGNLSLLAQGNVTFDIAGRGQATRRSWGIIDAPLGSMASPLNLSPLIDDSNGVATQARIAGYLFGTATSVDPAFQAYFHAAEPWHADDTDPVRVYALQGDITNGTGGGVAAGYLMPNKAARIEAGRDIVDLAYVGQQIRGSDMSVIKAGRDIVDTPLGAPVAADQPNNVLPLIVQAGPGYLSVQAGRDLGRLASQTDFYGNQGQIPFSVLLAPAGEGVYTGIDTVGNIFNPHLSGQGASIVASYGVAPGIDTAAFIARYIDPAAPKPAGLDDGSAALVTFVEGYDAGLGVDTGLLADRHVPDYTVDEAWARFQSLPGEAKAVFVQQTLFRVLAQVGKDYGDASSPFAGQYVRGYDALNTLFPASLGYTANGLDGGSNGARQLVHTGDLDIRGSTIQTQRGGDVSLLAPGGEALLGSSSAPPVIVDPRGNVLAGPNTQGILTLQRGNVSMFGDGSTLLAQSRIFTEQGGDVTIWSSNGDINAGKGAKTSSEIPPVRYLCTIDAWCLQDAAGQVSGAGIATLQTVAGAPEGSVYLMAPRGTVDAGDAGIRVSGNLVVAAAHVANADNVQVKGESIGLPVVQSVNVGALNAASSAASAATKAAEDVARQQQSDARDRMPSIISVQVLGGDPSASIDGTRRGVGYDPNGPVQVVRRGRNDGLTPEERSRMQ
ncbi:filamentous hemagglutinin family protein [Luteibacter aegosomatis]|uniref:filamentous haemagglutinin family protein n=1 Tax=Luteibacter aegosomatis TaxID=2911537 RepID=UPI001FFBE70B|nr:filamentous haemagglutinin family protein [Luteibacter aegosomatis]UPG87512.1 filamentous hemagglutinin family protein [Luteibacter aegosomatis]